MEPEAANLLCPFCGRIGKNKNSAAQHLVRCSLRPDRYGLAGSRSGQINYNPWNKGLTVATSKKLRAKSEALKAKYARGELVGHFKGKKHTEEEKQKISEAMKGNRNANHRGDRQIRYKDIRMDSKWEYAVAAHLDSIGVRWIYNERGFKLSDGRYYYPDFFIYDKLGKFSHLIEVKGYFRESNLQKFTQFKLEYPNVRVALWQQAKLTELGLLTCDGYIRVGMPSGEGKAL